MRIALITFLLACLVQTGMSQGVSEIQASVNKGGLYFYWGWNWSWFTKSDITFTGEDYNFTLSKVNASDSPTKFNGEIYFHPKRFTIPQYNFRIGYFFKEHWNLSFGIDHMKYVVDQYQRVRIDGYIDNGTSYDGEYFEDAIVLTKDFLQFEHTDGLNFINIDLRRSDVLFEFSKVRIQLTEGLGGGILFPRTKTTLMDNITYDEFRISGYGISAVLGINVTFFNHFFIQSELKGGYISMTDVRTTLSPADKAHHNFLFSQANILFGAIFNVSSRGDKK